MLPDLSSENLSEPKPSLQAEILDQFIVTLAENTKVTAATRTAMEGVLQTQQGITRDRIYKTVAAAIEKQQREGNPSSDE